MIAMNKDEATYAAEIITHLARLAYADGHVCGLTSAQWTALRFFGTASEFSRTLSAFADYHATTRSSASQTVKSLVAKGLLTRIPSELDGRSARFDRTEKGQSLCDRDPFESLVEAIKILPKSHQVNLAAILDNVLACIGEERQRQNFGTCIKCRFLKERYDQEKSGTTYICGRVGEEISNSGLHDICMNHRPRISVFG